MFMHHNSTCHANRPDVSRTADAKFCMYGPTVHHVLYMTVVSLLLTIFVSLPWLSFV